MLQTKHILGRKTSLFAIIKQYSEDILDLHYRGLRPQVSHASYRQWLHQESVFTPATSDAFCGYNGSK